MQRESAPIAGQFQSTPDLVNRENLDAAASKAAGGMFQSTPDLVNRENCLCS